MLDQIFDWTGYYEYPSFEVALFSLLLAFVLSSAIAITYRLTFKGGIFPKHLFQAIILSSIVTSMIMMAVGNNFAVGFGIIGAVAIIRFRTLISDPRNIIFMFAGISVGIGAGVYGYNIAIAGTAVFCLVAFILSFSSYGTPPEVRYEISIEYSPTDFKGDFDNLMSRYCTSYSLETQRKTELTQRRRYTVKLNKDFSSEMVFRELNALEGILQVRIGKDEVVTRL